jgi:hypothetical protein
MKKNGRPLKEAGLRIKEQGRERSKEPEEYSQRSSWNVLIYLPGVIHRVVENKI